MNPQLPLPPTDWNRGWAADLVRVAQTTLDDLKRQAGLGYRVSVFTPTRQISGNGTSATAMVGSVQVRVNGSGSTSVVVSGVGGSGSDASAATITAVLATLISDFRSKGTLG